MAWQRAAASVAKFNLLADSEAKPISTPPRSSKISTGTTMANSTRTAPESFFVGIFHPAGLGSDHPFTLISPSEAIVANNCFGQRWAHSLACHPNDKKS